MINQFKPIYANDVKYSANEVKCPEILKHPFHKPSFQLAILLAEAFMLGMIFAKIAC